ncbi:MAG: 30S ribosomal protein S8 [Candidatus Pelagibacter sp.]|nr:30S ribosomal protein S8 [Candidatus Pelagibacter sp.]
MTMSDPVSDMLTRIRNALKANKSSVVVPASKHKKSILDVLVAEGYIRGYSEAEERKNISYFVVELKYSESKPAIMNIKRVSTPGRRVYVSVDDLKPHYNGLGVHIISTSKGVITDHAAKQMNIGGEHLCSIY